MKDSRRMLELLYIRRMYQSKVVDMLNAVKSVSPRQSKGYIVSYLEGREEKQRTVMKLVITAVELREKLYSHTRGINLYSFPRTRRTVVPEMLKNPRRKAVSAKRSCVNSGGKVARKKTGLAQEELTSTMALNPTALEP